MKLSVPTKTTEKEKADINQRNNGKSRNTSNDGVFIATFLAFIVVGAVIAGMMYLKKNQPRW